MLIYDDEQKISAVYNLKTNDELFDDDKNIVHPILRIRKITRPKGKERWEILENNKTVIILRTNSLSKLDVDFLNTINGVQFIMNEYKSGNKSANKIREKLQAHRNKKDNETSREAFERIKGDLHDVWNSINENELDTIQDISNKDVKLIGRIKDILDKRCINNKSITTKKLLKLLKLTGSKYNILISQMIKGGKIVGYKIKAGRYGGIFKENNG